MRNESWFSERHRAQTLAFERSSGLVHAVADEPQGFASSVPPIWQASEPRARRHAALRKESGWHERRAPSSSDRFDDLYSRRELATFVEPFRSLARQTAETHVLFNHCRRDDAQRKATALRHVLERGAESHPVAVV